MKQVLIKAALMAGAALLRQLSRDVGKAAYYYGKQQFKKAKRQKNND